MGAVVTYKEYFKHLEELLHAAGDETMLLQTIVNGPFYNKFHTTTLDLGVIVLTLTDPATGKIHPTTYSNTLPANTALDATPLPFKGVAFQPNNKNNIISKAVTTGKMQKTSDWAQLFNPVFSANEARFAQSESGMECSYAVPFTARAGGALVFSFYQPLGTIEKCHESFMKDYTARVNDALAINNV